MRTLLLPAFMCLSSMSYAQGAHKVDMPVVCADTKFVVTSLYDKYNEKPTWNATDEAGLLVTTWVNEDNQTFTITKTDVDRQISCIISVGKTNHKKL